jgi:[lysine-biosynthesis-protein LysW]---L-2-aminoadipate ligase
VLNPVSALLAAHDKLRTARLLAAAGLPHPRCVHLRPGGPLPPIPLPLVVKPRFGSWGADVIRADTPEALVHALAAVSDRPWFRRHGALLQELVDPHGWDVRIVIAGGLLVGAVERVAAPGEWRTNISLGGTRRPADPAPKARELAQAAARAIGGDLVGVDLLPLADGGYTIVELNGAVDFNAAYSLAGDIYEAAAAGLGLLEEVARRPPDRGADAGTP